MNEREHDAPSGYTIDKDEQGLTQRDRDVRDLVVAGKSLLEIGDYCGFSRQRASQLRQSLLNKGVIEKHEGKYVLATKGGQGG